MKQRIVLVTILVLMIVLVIGMGFFFSSLFASGQGANTPIISNLLPTATPIPTPSPTPLPTPSLTAIPTPTPPPLFSGSSAYLIDATTGRVLLNAHSHTRVAMWSTTKVMTALLAIEALPPDLVVTIQQPELDEVPAGMSTAQLVAGNRISVLDLLYGLLLPSGSDAAVVLAHTVSGNTAAFVARMNVMATRLGLTDTHYMNPYGAQEASHYSSAADLVKLARAAMRLALFAQIVSTPQHHVAPDFFHNAYPWDNILTPFLQEYPGANGIKTGSDASETNWCMVFSASRHGHLLIGAEMEAPSEQQVFTDAENILSKGFASI